MATILLTHAEAARAHYYGYAALARLRELGEVRLNESGRPLITPQLIALARGCEVIVSDRATEGPAAAFEQLPGLVAFVLPARRPRACADSHGRMDPLNHCRAHG
jgi:D-3-phosphoglycerate dehydrogenase